MSALLPQLESRLGLLNRLIEAQRSTANNTDTSSSATHQIIVEINNVVSLLRIFDVYDL
jgi:hypothetical protein